MRGLVEFADRYGLNVEVSAHSFWNAGDSLLIEIEATKNR